MVNTNHNGTAWIGLGENMVNWPSIFIAAFYIIYIVAAIGAIL